MPDRTIWLGPGRVAAISSEWRVVVPENQIRLGLMITNTSDTMVCLAIGERPAAGVAVAAGTERGVALAADGGVLNMFEPILTTQAVYCRHGGAGEKNLAVQEVEGNR